MATEQQEFMSAVSYIRAVSTRGTRLRVNHAWASAWSSNHITLFSQDSKLSDFFFRRTLLVKVVLHLIISIYTFGYASTAYQASFISWLISQDFTDPGVQNNWHSSLVCRCRFVLY